MQITKKKKSLSEAQMVLGAFCNQVRRNGTEM